MNATSNKTKKILLGYLILTLYYLGVLVMLFAITYPPFREVHQNFREHALVLERYLSWVLYAPGVLMFLFAVALIIFRPAYLPKWAVTGSAALSLVSVATMFFCMVPLHQHWINTGFDIALFEQSKNIMFVFQIVPAVIQALLAVAFIYIYLTGMQQTTKLLFIALFVLCFFPMGTILVECHLNYALWAEVASSEWSAYRKLLVMPVFAAVFLIPFYFPIVLLVIMAFKKRKGLSRPWTFISLAALFYVFVISAAYFVPDIQFELDKYHSENLLNELIENEIWLRTPAELLYWASIALMFWKFESSADNTVVDGKAH